MRRRAIIALCALAVLGGAAQLIPVRRTNPPVAAPLRAPANVEAILDRCCADCHTNETRWPWYAHVAPTSWLVARDVRVGRDNLDFSYWGQLPLADQRHLAKSVVKEVDAGDMPYRPYLILHPQARPTTSEIRRLRDWFASPEATPGPTADSLASPSGPGNGGWDLPGGPAR